MRTKTRRIIANIYYLRTPAVEFLPVLCGMVGLLFLGGLCFTTLYQEPMSYREGLYHTYCLIFMEHLVAFPDHWILQLFFFALPPLGMAVILDGIVRFSYHILRRDEHSSEWVSAMSKTMKNHVILFGLGKLGLRVLQELLKLNELVIVVEANERCPNLVFAHKRGVPVRIGTGREEGILEDVNLAQAKSVIMATSDDLANLEVAIDARKLKSDIRVVLRMFDQELAEKIRESFDIHLAFSTWELSAPLFATASSDSSIINSFYVGGNLMMVATLTVGEASTLIGSTLLALRREHRVAILELRRGSTELMMPDMDTTLQLGDVVIVQCMAESLRPLRAANRSLSTD